MIQPLTYQRFSDDVFMLLVRANTPVKNMPEHPVIEELDEQMDASRECDPRITGHPYGPLTKPSAWRGFFTIGTCKFRVKSMYAFPKFFGLICDTESGTHSSTEIQAFVNSVNDAVKSRPTL